MPRGTVRRSIVTRSLVGGASLLLCVVLGYASAGCSRDATAATTTTTGATTRASAPQSTPAAAITAANPTTPAAASIAVAHATSLADFLPSSLDGIALQTFDDPAFALPRGGAAGAYLDSKTGKSININFMPVTELKFSRAQFHDLKPGETKNAPAAHLSFKGFDVGGFDVERTDFQTDPRKSEAIVIVADKVDVRVSVEPSTDPDEAVALMKQLDLAGMTAFLRK